MMSPSNVEIRRVWLGDVIVTIHTQSRGTYGWRRIQAELADTYGQVVNTKLIRTIMHSQGVAGLPTKRKGTPVETHRATTEDLVTRDFTRQGPNELWMTDITEHPTREGKV